MHGGAQLRRFAAEAKRTAEGAPGAQVAKTGYNNTNRYVKGNVY
jgi:hypothetical protein